MQKLKILIKRKWFIGILLAIGLFLLAPFYDDIIHFNDSENEKEQLQKTDQILTILKNNSIEEAERLIVTETGLTLNQIKKLAGKKKDISKSYCEIGLAYSVLGEYK